MSSAPSFGAPGGHIFDVVAQLLKIGPVLEPKYQKNLETFFLEAFLVAKPGRVTVRLLPNRIDRKSVV